MPSIICNSLKESGSVYIYKIGADGLSCGQDNEGKIEKQHVESVIKFKPCKNGSERFCIKLKLTLFD